LAAAELRAAETGLGADRALIAADIVSEEAYVAALAGASGIPFESLEELPRGACPHSDDALLDAARQGIVQIRDSHGVRYVVAPHNNAARGLLQYALRPDSGFAGRIAVTTAECMRNFVTRHAQAAIAARAADGLRRAHPEFSAAGATPRPAAALMILIAIAAALCAGLSQTPLGLAAAGFFLAWAWLRIAALVQRAPRHPSAARSDRDLPVYTIIVALYKEADAVHELVAALRRLDYPKEKLQIVFALEPDDRSTLARLAAMRLGAPFEIHIAPRAGPRTKPKALNAALAFARGTFVAVYDAEDKPEPDQLRRALDAFAGDDERLACVQARLTIDNTDDSWLACLFTAEYAGLFDVFLPALAARHWPLPLGGSSNHFRADILRAAGAWDPYNVTEDADLGMRLARLGYLSTVIDSATYEEAPACFSRWLRQRTRWMKGWMQTWRVHMRAPAKLMRDLGLARFAVFQLLVGGTVFAALLHPFLIATLLHEIATSGLATAAQNLATSLHGLALLSGYLASILLALAGLARRRLLRCAWALLLMPVYWLLLSVAAWRALHQLLRAPYWWEKTEHGLARHSRLAGVAGVVGVRDISAVRPRPPRGGA
jgi:cellulose synthase/poly-beta-1,6-N-acetylglucosamine synthase-like glycosyltransferase